VQMPKLARSRALETIDTRSAEHESLQEQCMSKIGLIVVIVAFLTLVLVGYVMTR